MSEQSVALLIIGSYLAICLLVARVLYRRCSDGGAVALGAVCWGLFVLVGLLVIIIRWLVIAGNKPKTTDKQPQPIYKHRNRLTDGDHNLN